jgi:hypothetical protein
MKYGYARVSTEDQNPALQLAALKKAGCRTVFKDEGISGATAQRPAQVNCLKTLQAGDTLIVRKLDRLGRSLRDLIHMLDDLKHRRVKFGRKPKLSAPQIAHARQLIESGQRVQDVPVLLSVGHVTLYRALERVA